MANLLLRGGKRNCRECNRLRAQDYYQPRTNRRRRAHLTKEEVADIRNRIADGQSHSKIAGALGTSIATVSNVRNGRGDYGR
jgi:DNA-binding NarL/FixJ family response regulator